MEFRKIGTTMPYAGQQKRHKNRLWDSGRWRGWDDLREEHWSMYITTCEIDGQCAFHAWCREVKAGALGQPRGTGWGGWWEGAQDWGHMYTRGWFMSMDMPPIMPSCHPSTWMAKTTMVSQECNDPIIKLIFFKKGKKKSLCFEIAHLNKK